MLSGGMDVGPFRRVLYRSDSRDGDTRGCFPAKSSKKPKKESKKVLTKAGERGIIYELPASGARDEREMLKSASGVEQGAILENDTV